MCLWIFAVIVVKMLFMTTSVRFIFQKDVEEIFEVFTNLFDIRIAFFSNNGEEVNVGKNKPLCRYCHLLREKLNLEETCLNLDRKMREHALEKRKTISYQCHGGMTEAITPIFFDDELVGFVMIGQFRTSKEPMDKVIQQRWKKEVGTEELEKVYLETPLYTPNYSKNILRLFEVLIDFIISQRLIEIENSSTIQPLIAFIENHLEENITLAQAAKIVCKSQSSISHNFKKITGKSFKQFQIDLKLAKADEYFKNKQDITVKEVAYKLGFDDPFYFSRLYKKHRGKSPDILRKQIHKTS